MNKINPYPVTSSIDELKNNEKIIQKQHFTKNVDIPCLKTIDNNKEKKPTDIITCMICDKIYTRSNKSKHEKTKHHIFCVNLNKKWRDSIIK